MQRRPALIATIAGCLSIACTGQNGSGSLPTAPGTPQVTPQLVDLSAEPSTIPPAAPAPAGMQLVADDPSLASFDDPTASAGDPAYLSGHWTAHGGTLVQDAAGPSTKLMVRRYVGPPAGGLPDRYRVEVSAWEYHYHGTDPGQDPGVLALIPYWRDAGHYAILSASAGSQQLWVNAGQEPGDPWPVADRLWQSSFDPPLKIGQAITWDVDVDVLSQHMTIYVDGQRQADVTTPFLTQAAHQVAIAANGDQIRFKGFRLWVPTGSNLPAPSVATPSSGG